MVLRFVRRDSDALRGGTHPGPLGERSGKRRCNSLYRLVHKCALREALMLVHSLMLANPKAPGNQRDKPDKVVTLDIRRSCDRFHGVMGYPRYRLKQPK